MLHDLVEHDPAVCWDRVLFSAKESMYKAWFPLTRRWLRFLDIEVHIEPDTAGFTVRPPGGEPSDARAWARRLSGSWTVDGGLLMAAGVVNR